MIMLPRHFTRPTRLLPFLTLFTMPLACNGDPAGTVSLPVAFVTISATRTNVAVGKTLGLSAVALNQNGVPVVGATYQWSSSSPSVATVSREGLVTGVAVGSVTITATAAGVAGVIDLVVGPITPL